MPERSAEVFEGEPSILPASAIRSTTCAVRPEPIAPSTKAASLLMTSSAPFSTTVRSVASPSLPSATISTGLPSTPPADSMSASACAMPACTGGMRKPSDPVWGRSVAILSVSVLALPLSAGASSFAPEEQLDSRRAALAAIASAPVARLEIIFMDDTFLRRWHRYIAALIPTLASELPFRLARDTFEPELLASRDLRHHPVTFVGHALTQPHFIGEDDGMHAIA